MYQILIMQDIKDLLLKKVSFQSAAWTPISKEMTIEEVLSDIRSPKYSAKIGNLRGYLQNGNDEAYNIHKKTLPAVTFCASFDISRRRENIKEYNCLIVVDIDKLDNSELNRVKEILMSNEYVLSYWLSPSGKGIKGLISVSYNLKDMSLIDSLHKSAFVKLSSYFFEKYKIELDESGRYYQVMLFIT